MTRRVQLLIAATAACYAVGYPVALIGGSAFGWVLVSLGGVGLLILGSLLVRHLASRR